VPPDTEVFIKKQDLIFGEKHYKKQAAKAKLLGEMKAEA